MGRFKKYASNCIGQFQAVSHPVTHTKRPVLANGANVICRFPIFRFHLDQQIFDFLYAFTTLLVSCLLLDYFRGLKCIRLRNACEIPSPPADCDSVDSEAGDLFQAYNDLPDLSVRYRNNGDFGHYQVAGMLRKLGYEPRQTQRISPPQRRRRCHFWA